MLADDNVEAGKYAERLNSIIVENAKNLRSDGMAWPLYFIKKYELEVTDEAFSETIKSKDCIALLCLYVTGKLTNQIVDFASELICKTLYERDQYWLLLYQLYKDGHIQAPYEDGVFDVLKGNDVDFMPEDGYSNLPQQYCDYLNNPFFEKGAVVMSFREWKDSL
ncbi:MAG: hypothetical protein RPT94_11970 [Candidatus Sedimenticola sp. (ex Thyasira tokunagai)]